MNKEQAVLKGQFVPHDVYRTRVNGEYTLLPFRFIALDSNRYIITNFAGEYLVVPKTVVHRLVNKELEVHSSIYNDLKAKHFLIDGESSIALNLLAAKYRTKQVTLSHFTSLHIFVVTLRCNHKCSYCQVSQKRENNVGYDMTEQMADAAIDFMFRSPAPILKVEFQGGEPLLRFGLVRYIVEQVAQRSRAESRNVEFVICTNLSPLTDEVLDFCLEHDIFISTSLDGPRALHNSCRKKPGDDSYEWVVQGIKKVRHTLGPDKVSALMTTTVASLSQPVEIVDEYLSHGFRSIFLRSINPYGSAILPKTAVEYGMDEWLSFYKEALGYILDLNHRGVWFREEYSAIILRRMLTPYGTGFVDLRSPAGIGIAVIVFNYDGDVYASDESRMLAEMGDKEFCLGNILQDSYEEIILSDVLIDTIAESMSESVPGCADCGIQPFCGSDPVRHYRSQGDKVGHKPTSEFCKKHIGVISHLVKLLEDNEKDSDVLRSWV